MKQWIGNVLQALVIMICACIAAFFKKLEPEQYMILTFGAFFIFVVIELYKEKEVKTPKGQLKGFEQNINEIPLMINPCEYCKVYKKKGGYETVVKTKDGSFVEGRCKQCCWYYDSMFEVEK